MPSRPSRSRRSPSSHAARIGALARGAWVALALLVAASGSACHAKATSRARVAVSIFPIYDLVRRVAGPDADVVLVLPPGKSPHGFAPGAGEAAAAARATLGVMVGLGLDAWMETLLKDASPKARLLKVGDRVPTLTLATGAGAREPDDAPIDPHVWLDPQRARLIVKAIGEELSRADARHAGAYRQRTSDVDASLGALDAELEAATASWKDRGVVTLHASFGYFAERYRLSIVRAIEAEPGAPPGAAAADELRALVTARKLAVFREPQLDGAPAEALARSAGVPLGTLDPIGGTAETDSYEKMLRFDVAALDRALH